MPNIRACIKEGPGKVSFAEVALPDPGPGQALIRTTLTTICGSDIHIVDDFDMIPAGMPMGHESIGIVEAVGEGVETLKKGDRIVAACLTGCGSCERCVEDEPQVCSTHGAPMNLLFGGQGEAFLLNGADFSSALIPSSIDDRQALFVSDIMSTGFAAIERAGMKEGQSVAIFAQGPVGLCTTAAAKTYGAGLIIAVESIPERVAMAKKLGAHHVVSPAGAADEIMNLTGGRGVDVAVEALGKQATLDNCFRVTRFGGTVSSVGVYGTEGTVSVPLDGSFYHRRFITTLCPTGRKRFDYLLKLIGDGRVDLTPMFTHDLALEDVASGYDIFRRRADGVIKIALS
ncbi:MAG TPA: zinc-binding dehydrogenase [Candidatus Limnocylindrales bacterium]|nr:zinc-binding dehydrogenase [Candidatus Limnocylindrales bacterium]